MASLVPPLNLLLLVRTRSTFCCDSDPLLLLYAFRFVRVSSPVTEVHDHGVLTCLMASSALNALVGRSLIRIFA